MTAKRHIALPYAPISIESLAYRIDCSPTTVRHDVDFGPIPRSTEIGSLVRWRWSEVEELVIGRSSECTDGQVTQFQKRLDEFSKAVLNHGKTPQAVYRSPQ